MKTITLTVLEKKALRSMLSDGFAFDAGNEKFLTYGVEEEFKGVIPSLVKKGVITTYFDKEEKVLYISVGKDLVIDDIVIISEYKD